MKNKLAIFDLDGTLFDTKQVNYQAYRDALGRYSIELSEEYFFSNCFGRYYKDFLSEIVKDTLLIEKVHLVKKNIYSKMLDKSKKNIHLFNFIEAIREDYYIAIVTTASRKNTMDILEYYGYETYFDMIVTAEDVINMKPYPDGFLYVMKRFNINAENTSIFEDSPIGIEAAKDTGAAVFTVNQF
ncbi:beta-phosphoglucomutase [Lachnospiraceae bacterium RM5]|nr:beta-phosphoglucomutase [Lachnospiraceae bacterium RM5]